MLCQNPERSSLLKEIKAVKLWSFFCGNIQASLLYQ
jgi:hypothetical protein